MNAEIPEDALRKLFMRGTKTLLMGAPGGGKTTSLTTMIEAGIELFVLITDPGGEEALIDAMELKKLPMDKLHWHYVAAASPSWETLMKQAKLINMMGYKALADIKSGIEKNDYQQFMELIKACEDFPCDRTGKTYGPIDKWGTDKCFALDSLSGVNTMALDMMIGAKPTAHMGEYGVSMNALHKFCTKLVADLDCFLVVNAHILKGEGLSIIVDVLGTKLAPKFPKDYSDVVLAYREGSDFYWSTSALEVDLKARTLPLSHKLTPSFDQVVTSWKRRKATVELQLATETKEQSNG